jgi:hypothetical protein
LFTINANPELLELVQLVWIVLPVKPFSVSELLAAVCTAAQLVTPFAQLGTSRAADKAAASAAACICRLVARKLPTSMANPAKATIATIPTAVRTKVDPSSDFKFFFQLMRTSGQQFMKLVTVVHCPVTKGSIKMSQFGTQVNGKSLLLRCGS